MQFPHLCQVLPYLLLQQLCCLQSLKLLEATLPAFLFQPAPILRKTPWKCFCISFFQPAFSFQPAFLKCLMLQHKHEEGSACRSNYSPPISHAHVPRSIVPPRDAAPYPTRDIVSHTDATSWINVRAIRSLRVELMYIFHLKLENSCLSVVSSSSIMFIHPWAKGSYWMKTMHVLKLFLLKLLHFHVPYKLKSI